MAVATRRKRAKKLPPRAVYPAGSPEAVEIVRSYLQQRARLADRGLEEAEQAVERQRVATRRRSL
jgi:hypothetical protein